MLTMTQEALKSVEPQSAANRWAAWQLVAFRFVCLYFVIYEPMVWTKFVPFGTEKLNEQYDNMWHLFIPWVGANFLHLAKPITIFPNGSGDTTFNYVQILCYLTIAAAGTLIWSIIDWKRSNYSRLHQWLRLFVRFCLAAPLFGYGASKIFEVQFGTPGLTRLLETYGNSTPMVLVWNMMGFSRSYCMFAGLAEVVGGLLLLVPRLTTLGSLICAGVMLNIFMLNMCYDIPVKLYSFHLLLMSFFLLIPDLKRLLNILVLNRATSPQKAISFTNHKWLNIALLLVPLIAGLGCCYKSLEGRYKFATKCKANLQRILFYGIWQVDEFVVDGKAKPLLVSESGIWNKVVFDDDESLSIHLTNGQRQWYFERTTPKNKTITLSAISFEKNPKEIGKVVYDDLHAGKLVLHGIVDGKRLRVVMHPEKNEFRLLTRGFHWINERPYVQ